MRRIPDSEFSRRWAQAAQILEAHSLDGAFVYYDELRSAAGWYLSGWSPQFESGAVVVSTSGELAILGGPESEPFAKLDARVQRTFNVPVFMVPDEEYPRSTIHSLPDALTEALGRAPRRLGCVGLQVMPTQVHEQLRGELPGVELVDVTEEFEALRVIKSSDELAVMREAFAINHAGYLAMKDAVRAGASEREIAGAGEGAARARGADWFGFRTIVGSGPRAAAVVPTASERAIGPGEPILVGISARLDGYATAAGNVLSAGELAPEAAEHMHHLSEAFRIAREQLRPGGVGREIDAPIRAYLEQQGYAPYLLIPFFHTQGLNEADPPFFGPRSDDSLEEGMVIAIDVSMFAHPELPGARLETVYEITGDGAEPLCEEMESELLGVAAAA